MSLAELVIVSVKVEGRSKSEVARDYKISRYWVQQLVRRYEAEGEAAFQPRSRRPHTNPRAISLDLEDQIVRLRKELSKQGLDAGAETIRTPPETTARRGHAVPSISTIWRVLTRRGFVTPQPQETTQGRRGNGSTPSNPTNAGRPTSPTGSWPTAPGWRSSTSSTTTPGWTCCPSARAAPPPAPTCVAGFRAAFRRYGIPASVLTDNGAVFTGKPRRGGRVALEVELDLLGVRFHHSRPYHPQTCGKVERFHQTQKKWLAAQPPPPPWPTCNASSTGSAATTTPSDRTAPSAADPRQAYTARPKATPTGPSSTPTTGSAATRSTPAGTVTLRYNSRLHHIGLGREPRRHPRPAARRRPLHPRRRPPTPANSSASSPSTPPATTSPAES